MNQSLTVQNLSEMREDPGPVSGLPGTGSSR